ncbi:hypothetical protein DPMN_043509 [Dreissena polymorpha]|uniref:Uncharacterized protein n=1 Tax=Dreissena polymorpha TaxID=45954 RepID=A0A9D4D0N0_DREPO|nr:hypothetical protein DPMN_043509 [Dreissena polymorpha]
MRWTAFLISVSPLTEREEQDADVEARIGKAQSSIRRITSGNPARTSSPLRSGYSIPPCGQYVSMEQRPGEPSSQPLSKSRCLLTSALG